VDYVNISKRFVSLEDALSECAPSANGSAVILPVADGGFSSRFRWAGVWAVSLGIEDSEDILDEAVSRLQDPARNEVGAAECKSRSFTRVSENAA
jgi:hypothetical protein